ncbi:MAG: histidine kinase [Prevotella sp.]|nr:histidine kinase [Prevotella sp.]
MKITKREWKENLVYLVLWLMMFIAPVITTYVRSIADSHLSFQWHEVIDVWRLYAVYLVIFVVHNYLLAPILIYRNKKALYFTSITLMLVAFILYQCQSKPMGFGDRHHGPRDRMMHDKEVAFNAPGMHGEMMFGENDVPMDAIPFEEGADTLAMAPPEGMHHPPFDERHKPEGMPPLHMGLENVFSIIVFLLMLGMNLGIKLYFKMDEDAKGMKELEKRSLEQQLAYLKYQINPHFFMNTLNNIHALVDINPEKAKETILILSKIMRHVLYEGDKSQIPIQREIDFLNNYIDLMKIRYSDKVSITLEQPDRMPDAGIPPLLLITFVENAFKHGVSYQNESFIFIKISVDDNRLKFFCRNSRQPKKENSLGKTEGGVGLANIKQRLNLLYGENYTLDFEEGDDTYEVLLLLPLTPHP